MPTFDFKCKCGNIFEELILDNARVSCPKCGNKTLEKLMGTPRVIFKGSGWTTYDGQVTKDLNNMIKNHDTSLVEMLGPYGTLLTYVIEKGERSRKDTMPFRYDKFYYGIGGS